MAVNSRPLYRLSYAGTVILWRQRDAARQNSMAWGMREARPTAGDT